MFLPEGEAIMGKDGSHEKSSACGNGSYKGEKLIRKKGGLFLLLCYSYAV